MRLTYKAGVKIKNEKAVEKAEPVDEGKPVERPRGKKECKWLASKRCLVAALTRE